MRPLRKSPLVAQVFRWAATQHVIYPHLQCCMPRCMMDVVCVVYCRAARSLKAAQSLAAGPQNTAVCGTELLLMTN